MALLTIRDLTLGFGSRRESDPVLNGVTLEIEAGEAIGLTGANGVGKSTLLRLAAGLLRPDRGRVRVAGESPDRARRRGRIGWCTSGESSFTRRLSLRSNLATSAALAGVPRARFRIEAVAEELGFHEYLELPAGRCSSGVRQRAALARALLHRPDLLLLDEPLRSVDNDSALQLASLLRASWKNEAVLWVSHSPEELGRVADRVLHLDAGRLQPWKQPVWGRRCAA